MATPPVPPTPSGSGKQPAAPAPSPTIPSDPIPQGWARDIDPTTWGSLLDLDKPENLTPARLTGHILTQTEVWSGQGPRNIWSQFAEEFRGWDQDTWEIVPNKAARWLRDFLTNHGVYVSWDNATRITDRLETVAKVEDFHEWSPEEIKKQANRSGLFKAKMQDPAFASEIVESPEWEPPTIPSPYEQPQPKAIPFRPVAAPYSLPPPPPEHDPGTRFRPRPTSFDRPTTTPYNPPATTPHNPPATTPYNLSVTAPVNPIPPLADGPLPLDAATHREEKGPTATTEDGDGLARARADLSAESGPLPADDAADRGEEGPTATTGDGDDLVRARAGLGTESGPLPRGAATGHQNEDGDTLMRPGISNATAKSTARITIRAARPVAFPQEHEAANEPLLFLFTKEDADAALAVRLRTEGRIKGDVSRPSYKEARDDSFKYGPCLRFS